MAVLPMGSQVSVRYVFNNLADGYLWMQISIALEWLPFVGYLSINAEIIVS